MAVCVATQTPSGLSRSVSILLMVQHLAVVGKLAGQQVPNSLTWVAELFTVLSMLNFDLQFVKPGCVVGALSFLNVYWATYGLVAVSAAMFAVASLIRAKPWREASGAQQVVEIATGDVRSSTHPLPVRSVPTFAAASTPRQWQWQSRFKIRLTHAYLILCSVLYLRLSILTMEALQCTHVQLTNDGPLVSVLAIDLTTNCYHGGHLVTVILLVWPTLFLFCLGFPLLSAWLLYRSFHQAARRAVGEGKTTTTDGAAQADEPSDATGHIHVLQKEQSVNRAWLSSSSSGCTSPIANSAPATPIGTRNVFDWTRPGRPLLTVANSRSRVHAAVSSSSHSPRSVNSAADYRPPPDGSSSTSPRRPLTPAVFASRIPTAAIGKMVEDQPLSTWTEGQLRGEAARQRPPSSLSSRALSPVQRMLRQLGSDAARQEQYGYLFRQLKGECYYFRLLFLLTSFGFASASVLPSSPILRLFLTGVFFLADQLIVLVFTPFEQPWRNLLSAGLSMVGAVQCMVMLALVQLGLSNGTSTRLDLGHSTASQAASVDPNNALTGVSYVAAYYELVLGMVWLATALVVAIVHRRYIHQTVRGAVSARTGWLSTKREENVREEHKRLESNTWQTAAPDRSSTPRSPADVELTKRQGASLLTAPATPSRQHVRALNDAHQATALTATSARLTIVKAASRTHQVTRSDSQSQMPISRELSTAHIIDEHQSASEDETEETLNASPSLQSSLTMPLATSTSPPARTSVPAVTRNPPPVRVQRLPSIPVAYAHIAHSTAHRTSASFAAVLPGAVETPAGSRRESQY